MQHISTTPFGRRPVDVGILAAQHLSRAPAPVHAVDKWPLFDALRTARNAFGLSDRDLTVLYALMSFLPARELADGAELIVFPSNASLSERANGMPESTLRRHLAALVNAGMIARCDSPNGKRYATRARDGHLTRAFGFSLRPLLVRAPEIETAAEHQREDALRLHSARESVVIALRDATKLIAWLAENGTIFHSDWDARLDPIRKALRRKMDHALLDALSQDIQEITLALSTLTRAPQTIATPKTSGNDVQNERHQKRSNPEIPESESTPKKCGMPMEIILKACPDLEVFARHQIRTTEDLVNAAIYVRGMMGISVETWNDAERIMGSVPAAISIGAILQRMASIRNPGGYLRDLTKRAASGVFSPERMIMALLSPANDRAA